MPANPANSAAAVVVGVNYSNRTSGRLNYAEPDAREMADVLKRAGFEVERLLGSEATRQAIIDATEHQCNIAGRDGLVLFYFSGHGGSAGSLRPGAYLIPVDGDSSQMASSCISLSDLPMRYLSGVQTGIVLLDCCHSGAAVGAEAFRQQAQGAFLIAPMARVILAACAEDTVAYETSSLGHGYFTYYLLDYWRNHAKVNLDLLYDMVVEEMDKHKNISPPVRGGAYKGRLILPGLRSPNQPAPQKPKPPKPTRPPSHSNQSQQSPFAATPATTTQTAPMPPMPTGRPVDIWLHELDEAERSGNWQLVIEWGERILGYPGIEREPTTARLAHAYLQRAQAFRLGYSERISPMPDVSWVSSEDRTRRVRDACRPQWSLDLTGYTRALDLWPTAQVYRLRGILYLRTADYENAIADFDESISLDSDQVDVYAFRAESYHREDSCEPAIADYTRAIARYKARQENRAAVVPIEFPLSCMHYFRGVCYRETGRRKELANMESTRAARDYKASLDDINQALELALGEQDGERRRMEYFYGRGMTLLAVGKRAEARRDFERAGSSHLAARRELQYLNLGRR